MRLSVSLVASVLLAAFCLSSQRENYAGMAGSGVYRNRHAAQVRGYFPTRQRAMRLPPAHHSATNSPAAPATNDVNSASLTNAMVRYIPPPAPKVDPEKLKAEKERLTQNTVKWQMQRAEEGSSTAQYGLGIRYLNGDGVEKDPDKARLYLRKAADGGEDRAIKKLEQLDAPPPPKAEAPKSSN